MPTSFPMYILLGSVSLDSTSLLSLKATVTGLLEDVERKQNLIQQLLGNANKEKSVGIVWCCVCYETRT